MWCKALYACNTCIVLSRVKKTAEPWHGQRKHINGKLSLMTTVGIYNGYHFDTDVCTINYYVKLMIINCNTSIFNISKSCTDSIYIILIMKSLSDYMICTWAIHICK